MAGEIHPGCIYIVGAGPGDPELVTVRGMRLLEAADVVFYAGSLVPEDMLQYCRPQAECIDTRSLVLETLVPAAIAQAKADKVVVRLQDGDPCLYGALHEMALAYLDAGVDFEVVPGVSAFQAAAARLQVELTVPDLVQSIILTRASGRTAVPAAEDLASMAAHRASLCLYLSAHHSKQAQASLLEHYPPDTPIAMCYRVGWPDECIVRGTLNRLHELTQTNRLNRTVLYLISPALRATASRSQLYSPQHDHLFRPHHCQEPSS